MRVVDADALTRINQIITEHAVDLEMAQVAPGNLYNYIILHIRNIIRNDISYLKVFCCRGTSNKNGSKIVKFG